MMDHLLYGAAYYDEYMPCERLEKDADMLGADRGVDVGDGGAAAGRL